MEAILLREVLALVFALSAPPSSLESLAADRQALLRVVAEGLKAKKTRSLPHCVGISVLPPSGDSRTVILAGQTLHPGERTSHLAHEPKH